MKNDSLSDARAAIQKARYVATFSGAGLSAESGLATFRDTETDALWSRYDPRELASIDGFEKNPERVSDWYRWRRSKYVKVVPNPAHYALADQKNLVHVTQNVDNLLEQAGVRTANVLHLHGTITRDRCHNNCGHEEEIELQNPPRLRRCPQCNAYMRPSVVWFGEGLPSDVWRAAEAVCRRADCLLVIGTSAVVYPAASLIEVVSSAGGQVIVINTRPDDSRRADNIEIVGPAGEVIPELLDGIELSSS